MISRKELFEREDGFLFERCVAVDKATKETMNQLGLKMFKSSKDRTKDVEKARELYKNILTNYKGEFAIHHLLDGRVGLIPTELHKHVRHNGYFKRLALS